MVSLAPADQVSGGLISGPQVLLSLHQLPVGNRLAWRGQEMGEQERCQSSQLHGDVEYCRCGIA